jgi:hypothetical protein
MAMTILLLHDDYSDAHLEDVKRDMVVLGAPRIKAVEHSGAWVAIEGCHRIRAAKALGLVPEIEAVEYDAETTTVDLGMEDGFDGDVHVIRELVSKVIRNCRTYIDFADEDD